MAQHPTPRPPSAAATSAPAPWVTPGRAGTRFRLATPEGVDVPIRLAGVGPRLGALLLDALLQLVLALVALLAGAALALLVGGEFGGLLATVLLSSLFLGLVVGYPMVFELLLDGRTPGMLACGLRVVRADGRRIDAAASLARNASRLVELPLLYLPAFVLCLGTPHRQRLGDLVAGTLVVHAPTVPRRMLVGRPAGR